MTNIDKLKELYAAKVRDEGLVHVGLSFDRTAITEAGASAEDLAGELLALDQAIKEGRVQPLDFGDATLSAGAREAIRLDIEAARAAGIEPLVFDGTVSRDEFEIIASTRPFLTPGTTATNAQILDQVNKVLAQIKAGDYEVVELDD